MNGTGEIKKSLIHEESFLVLTKRFSEVIIKSFYQQKYKKSFFNITDLILTIIFVTF